MYVSPIVLSGKFFIKAHINPLNGRIHAVTMNLQLVLSVFIVIVAVANCTISVKPKCKYECEYIYIYFFFFNLKIGDKWWNILNKCQLRWYHKYQVIKFRTLYDGVRMTQTVFCRSFLVRFVRFLLDIALSVFLSSIYDILFYLFQIRISFFPFFHYGWRWYYYTLRVVWIRYRFWKTFQNC